MEQGQAHPLAQAILSAPIEISSSIIDQLNFQEMPNYLIGRGVKVDDWYLGSINWIAQTRGKKIELPSAGLGQIILGLADADGLIAYLIFEDEARSGVSELIELAKVNQMSVHLISGDDPVTVKAWADRFGIFNFRGQMLPEDKRAYIQALQIKEQVLAVGDGINDAPQLGQADVSVAVGKGAPLAQAGADIILIDSSLASLAKGIAHAKFTKRVIGQNLLWAFLYNVGAIPVAILGLVNPWVAGIGMSLSSLLVTLNAWRLRKI